MKQVVIVNTGIANTASLISGFERLEAHASLSFDPEVILNASFVVLPGVSAFGACMEEITKKDLVDSLRDRIKKEKPILCVCAGLQLLFEKSEESPGVKGLSIFAGHVKRFPTSVKAPQLGWNEIEAAPECKFLKSGYVYFANSYCVSSAPAGFAAARADYGIKFIAGFEKGNLLACQFHPELSGPLGLEIIKAWLRQ